MNRLRFVLPGLLLALLPLTASAQKSLVIERFDSDIHVQTNGDAEIAETIRARFTGSWNGIFRDLSLEHRTASNRRERLDVDLTSITDANGEPLRFETSRQGAWTRRFKIWVPGAENATRTVVIRYVVHNALRFFSEDSNVGPLDEIYWNATGNAWEIPIEHAAASVTLPDGAKPQQWAGYTGPAGSKAQDVSADVRGQTVTFAATRSFYPGEGLTVAVGWPPGVVTRPAPPSAIGIWASQGLPLAFPIVIFTLAFSAWRRSGKDPEPRAIVVQYAPPAQLTPAEVGTLIDHKADMHDITATLVDLAVRGYIHIEKRNEKKLLGLMSSTEYAFHLKKPEDQWRGLFEHEQAYLQALFKARSGSGMSGLMRFLGGDSAPDPSPNAGAGEGPTYGSVELSSLKNEFYRDLPGIKKSIYQQLVTKGHYRKSPESVKTVWMLGAFGVVAAGIFITNAVSKTGFLGLDPTMVGVASAISAITMFIFAAIMPARTLRGARAREAALGFKEFLDRVEEDRFKRMITSPGMFENFLPFAMAFKVEKKWAKAFEDMYTEPPRWYSGYDGGHFHTSSFTRDMNAMSMAAGSTMSSSPSGSGGGGSSGGGSGGGGGGGF
jgi:Predicted membrane protein (DUF2207) C-terminal domain/Predicted membrane protein (DUF2207) N-terminal domain